MLSIASFPSGKPGKVARCACSHKLCHDDFHHLHYHDHWTLIQQPSPALSDHHHYIMFCPGRFFRGVLCDRYKYLQSDTLNYSAGNWSLIAGSLNRDNRSSHTLTMSHLRSSSYLDTLLQFTITLADTPSQITGVLKYRLVLVYCLFVSCLVDWFYREWSFVLNIFNAQGDVVTAVIMFQWQRVCLS